MTLMPSGPCLSCLRATNSSFLVVRSILHCKDVITVGNLVLIIVVPDTPESH